jgi:hypothetical protein
MSRDDPRPPRESAAPHEEWDEPGSAPGPEAEADPGADSDSGKSADGCRRRDDCFAPPAEPCECWCLHCRRVFMSDQIWFQRVINDPQGFDGFWMCPTPNCGGAGFTFDIFPTDPDHPANDGWSNDDDDGEGDYEGEGAFWEEDEEQREWDPDESKYKELDEAFGEDGDDDIEGEEWKFGLMPGERPPEPDWAERARREEEEEERKYDQPDERPRVVDWRNREDRRHPPGGISDLDDDIPF